MYVGSDGNEPRYFLQPLNRKTFDYQPYYLAEKSSWYSVRMLFRGVGMYRVRGDAACICVHRVLLIGVNLSVLLRINWERRCGNRNKNTEFGEHDSLKFISLFAPMISITRSTFYLPPKLVKCFWW